MQILQSVGNIICFNAMLKVKKGTSHEYTDIIPLLKLTFNRPPEKELSASCVFDNKHQLLKLQLLLLSLERI